MELKKVLKSLRTLPYLKLILSVAVLAGVSAFCEDPTLDTHFASVSKTITDVTFNKWILGIALTITGGLGLCKAIGSGSLMPLVKWLAIGAIGGSIPTIATALSSLT